MSLLTKYRPRTFDDIIGHSKEVASLRRALAKRSTHAFLFTGPAGIGKTSLAYLSARELNGYITEVKAAVNNGIDDVRALIDEVAYKPLNAKTHVVLMEEVHALTKQAWQALLKEFEDPPAHVYWMLTTTELNKVPAAIKTRCASYILKPIKPETIYDLLKTVCREEGIKMNDKVLSLCAEFADGSPRQGLANLIVCDGIKDVDTAAEMLEGAGSTTQAIDLARALLGRDWEGVAAVFRKMEEGIDAESVRRVICAYHAKMALIPGRGKGSVRVLATMSQPLPQNSGRSILIALCSRLYAGHEK
jgi:DNA polymerase-3 subunit gamma/tau